MNTWLPPDHDRWADSTGAYLLDALPPTEVEGFERHLEHCETCRQEVRELRIASDALPGSVSQLDPPPELKQRIMAIVEAEAAAARPVAERSPRRARRDWREALLRPMRVRPAALVPVLSALLALGVLAGLALRSADGPRTTTVVAEIDPREVPGARAQLVRQGDSNHLEVSGMPQLEDGHVYQVWLKPPGEGPEPTNALFSVRPDGTASVRVPGSLSGMEAVLVTEEPDGGSLQPSSSPIISAVLSS